MSVWKRRGPVVTIEDEEVKLAIMVGATRRMNAMTKGYRDKLGVPNDWRSEIEGAAGEIAFARFKNWYFDPTTKIFDGPDVGEVQVKTDSNNRHPSLKVPVGSDPSLFFVLMIGLTPHFEIAGYIKGSDAMNEKRYKVQTRTDGKLKPAHFVPAGDLLPMPKRAVDEWREREKMMRARRKRS